MDAVLSIEVGGTGENLFLVFEDGLDHLGDGGGRGVVGGAGLEMFYDLGAAVAGALHDALQSRLIHEFSDRNTGNSGIARQREHGVAVSTDDAFAWEAAHLVGGLGHGVEGIGDDDEDAVRRVAHDLADYVIHDFVVGIQKVITAHTGLARNSGGDDDDGGVGRGGVVVRADNVGIALLDRHGLEEVETFSLGDALHNVNEDDVG